jgi:hypothetical protein
MDREDLLARTFVELADTLVDDFDLVEVTQMLVERCVQLFDATAAGLLLADPNGSFRVASPTDQLHVVELLRGASPRRAVPRLSVRPRRRADSRRPREGYDPRAEPVTPASSRRNNSPAANTRAAHLRP